MDDSSILPNSYFWSCITLNEGCPFFTSLDPKLYYFGIGIAVLYAAIILIILWDIHFYWPLDHMQHQMGYYMDLICKKLWLVESEKRSLVSIKERTEKHKKRSEDHCHTVMALRSALQSDNPEQYNIFTSFEDMEFPSGECEWVDEYF